MTPLRIPLKEPYYRSLTYIMEFGEKVLFSDVSTPLQPDCPCFLNANPEVKKHPNPFR